MFHGADLLADGECGDEPAFHGALTLSRANFFAPGGKV
jgi:hypothetical protein